jgi:hypothetical protein
MARHITGQLLGIQAQGQRPHRPRPLRHHDRTTHRRGAVFVKKTQKTPQREIKVALKRAEEIA